MAKKKREINIINIDKNGNVIKDMSKLVVPREMQIDLLKTINKRRVEEARKNEC